MRAVGTSIVEEMLGTSLSIPAWWTRISIWSSRGSCLPGHYGSAAIGKEKLMRKKKKRKTWRMLHELQFWVDGKSQPIKREPSRETSIDAGRVFLFFCNQPWTANWAGINHFTQIGFLVFLTGDECISYLTQAVYVWHNDLTTLWNQTLINRVDERQHIFRESLIHHSLFLHGLINQ